MKKISFIFGTRPEAIKLCPLILAFRKHTEFDAHVCVTGQHREMLDQVLEVFEVVPDVDLALMQPNQTLGGLTSRAIAAIDAYLDQHKSDMVIIQGDTTTAFCAALCAFYHRIPVGHVEAGLRTWNKYSPFPEEINRVLATRIADLHFAPTNTSRDNLYQKGISHINVGTGEDIPIRDLAVMIKDVVGFKGKIAYDSTKPDGMPKKLLNVSRLQSYGWRFKIGLEQGIRKVYQWYVDEQAKR